MRVLPTKYILGAAILASFSLSGVTSALATGGTGWSCATLPVGYDVGTALGYSASVFIEAAEGDTIIATNTGSSTFNVAPPVGPQATVNAGTTLTRVVTAAEAGTWNIYRPDAGESSVTCVVAGASQGDLQSSASNIMSQQTINNIASGAGKSIMERFSGNGNNNANLGQNSANAYFSTNNANRTAVLSALDGITEADLGPNGGMNIWASVAGNWYNSTGGGATLSGWTGSAVVGIDNLVHSNVVLGGFVAAEAGNISIAAPVSLSGIGLTAGVYTGIEVAPNVVLQATLSDTWLSYTSTVGAGTGNFWGNRVAATVGLTGTYDLSDQISMAPTLRGQVVYEYQSAYTNSLAVAVPAMNITSGRISFGSTFYYTLDQLNSENDTRVSLLILGDYDMSSAVPVSTFVPRYNGVLSARVGVGMETTFANGANLGFAAEVGGLFANTQSYGASATLSVPMN